MEKQKIEYIITGVMVVILLLLLTTMLKKKTKKVPEEIQQQEAITESTGTKVYMPKLPQKLTWGRDPFVLYSRKAKGSMVPFVLSAVIYDEKEPHAVINNEIVTIGQKIEGYSVIKINEKTAVLKKEDKELRLELYE